MRALQAITFVVIADVLLCGFGILVLSLGDKMRKAGMIARKQGILPAKSLLGGQPESEATVPKEVGSLLLFLSLGFSLFGGLALIAMPVFTIGFLYAVFQP